VICAAALKIIEDSEGCVLKAYKDQVGVWTIGWGHTGPEVVEGLVWTQAQADEQFLKDVAIREQAVRAMVPNSVSNPHYYGVRRAVSENEVGALTSLVFNVGAKAVYHSELLALFHAGDTFGAAKLFLRWDHAGGEKSAGLLLRRFKEGALFLTP
jgi:lysozyme